MRKTKMSLVFLFLWMIVDLFLYASIPNRRNELKDYLLSRGISNGYI